MRRDGAPGPVTPFLGMLGILTQGRQSPTSQQRGWDTGEGSSGPGLRRDPEGSVPPALQPAGHGTHGFVYAKTRVCGALGANTDEATPESYIQVPVMGWVDFTKGIGAPAGSGNHQAEEMEEKRKGVASRGGRGLRAAQPAEMTPYPVAPT